MTQREHTQSPTSPPAPAPASALPPATASASAPPAPAVKSTKRHWRALRNALCSKPVTASGDTTASSISTEFFPVFPAQRPSIQVTTTAAAAQSAVSYEAWPCRRPEENFEWVRYDVSMTPGGGAAAAKPVYVHEKQKNKRVTISELLSHKVNEGVDNTGNVRTWPSEQVLLSFLLKNEVCQRLYRNQSRGGRGEPVPLNCCELGSGMAGLASLGLLAHALVPFRRFDVTDGNPLAVKNLKLCVDENAALGAFAKSAVATSVNVNLLRWNRHATFGVDQLHQFDLLLASDCLFFEEFHMDLAYTIKQLLKPSSGRCFMLQPSRSGSMERFVAIAQSQGLHVERCDDFDSEISRKHASYLTSRTDYVPDVHLPILLTLSSI